MMLKHLTNIKATTTVDPYHDAYTPYLRALLSWLHEMSQAGMGRTALKREEAGRPSRLNNSATKTNCNGAGTVQILPCQTSDRVFPFSFSMQSSFLMEYSRIAVRKFLFFHGKSGAVRIKDLLTTPFMQVGWGGKGADSLTPSFRLQRNRGTGQG